MLKLIFITVSLFLLSFAFSDWKKAKSFHGFDKWIKGKINDLILKDNSVFFEVKWQDPFTKEEKIYFHLFSNQYYSPERINLLIQKFVGKHFFLSLKIQHEQVTEIKPYSNARITFWIYLILGIMGLIFTFYSK